MGWDGMGCDRMGWDVIGWDWIGWDRMGSDGIGFDWMGSDGIGLDWMGSDGIGLDWMGRVREEIKMGREKEKGREGDNRRGEKWKAVGRQGEEIEKIGSRKKTSETI